VGFVLPTLATEKRRKDGAPGCDCVLRHVDGFRPDIHRLRLLSRMWGRLELADCTPAAVYVIVLQQMHDQNHGGA